MCGTRTGYSHGVIEEGDSLSGLVIGRGSNDAIDTDRRKAERAAYDKLLASFQPFWGRIHNRFR